MSNPQPIIQSHTQTHKHPPQSGSGNNTTFSSTLLCNSDDSTLCNVIYMQRLCECAYEQMVRSTGRKVNGRVRGIPSCLICSTSLTSARRMLHPPIPANQGARLFFLQFVAGAAHLKYYKHATPSPPLNGYTCKPCFGKLDRARSVIMAE